MAKQRFINIDFPFKDSPEGFYFNLNATDADAIRADLLHLLLTNKGERLYSPDFGSDLKKFIFEPNDSITHEQIKDNLNETIKRYMPNLIINDITFNNDSVEELIIVKLTYTVTDGTFKNSDSVTLTSNYSSGNVWLPGGLTSESITVFNSGTFVHNNNGIGVKT